MSSHEGCPHGQPPSYDGLSPSIKVKATTGYPRRKKTTKKKRGRAEVARQARNLGLTFRG